MQFSIKRGDLLKELQYVQGVVERKNTVPILSHLLLETTGTYLVVTATDLDVSIQCVSPASIKVSGALTVSARKLFDIARLLPDAEVHFKAQERDWVQITCEKSKFRVAGLGKENFPDIPTINGTGVHLPAGMVHDMISRSIFAITQEESRYALNGALMILRPNGMSMVTTDGHRLALVSRDLELQGVDQETRFLVPKKTLVELSKLASEETSTLEFNSTENHLFFKVGKRLLVSRLLAGQFPNYEIVIPKENDKKVCLNTSGFTDALKRAAVMADEQSHAVRLSFREGQLEISATTTDIGEAREIVPADYQGEPFEIGFNAQYLLDFLTGLESEEVSFELRDADTQGLLQPKGKGDYLYHYVTMPMKL